MASRRPVRLFWFVLGWIAVALGTIGAVVPGLPTTVFFVAAASCFARSSPRFERWVLELPGVGRMVRDYRAGLGMPRRAKQVAVAMIAVAVGISAAAIDSRAVGAAVVVAGGIGIWYVLVRVPTRERVADQSG